jgi:hypothetical protein
MPSVPRAFLVIHGLREPAEPLHLVHYLCLESCRRVNRPAAMHLYCPHPPAGEWWERIAPHVAVHTIGHRSFVADSARYEETDEGRAIRTARNVYAHESDFLRLEVLLRYGGVYADLDTLFLRPIPDALYEQEFALGEVTPLPGRDGILRPALGNALLLAAPKAAFARRWLERMYAAFDGTWKRHADAEAGAVWRERPSVVRVVAQQRFYKHTDSPEGLAALLVEVDPDLDDALSLHLWAHRWWDARPGAGALPHAGTLTEHWLRTVDCTYSVAARRFLDPE